MANFNKVILLGNLTRDPQLRYLPSNTAVCDFGLAVNRKYRGQDGELKDETCFVDVDGRLGTNEIRENPAVRMHAENVHGGFNRACPSARCAFSGVWR